MSEATSQNHAPKYTGGTDSVSPLGGEPRELVTLFKEALQLLDATDLLGANETLKVAEQVLGSDGRPPTPASGSRHAK